LADKTTSIVALAHDSAWGGSTHRDSNVDDATQSIFRKLYELAGTVRTDSIDEEMGEMCRHSLFAKIRNGERVTQEQVDSASQTFITVTQRFMPPELVHSFIDNACVMQLPPEIEEADLVPGFTHDESIAGGDAALRLSNEMKRFTHREVLRCLAWNRAAPEIPVAIAHFISLIRAYTEVLAEMVTRRSPSAGEKFERFASQWASRNLLKFTNLALWVRGNHRGQGDAFVIDQPLIDEAMELLNRSAAFTWSVQKDAAVSSSAVERIHCPAQAFVQKLIVNQGTLLRVIQFVQSEAARIPCPPELSASLDFMREFAEKEETRIHAKTPNG
jgi:hypothetical protein